jgi:hypothetical protein
MPWIARQFPRRNIPEAVRSQWPVVARSVRDGLTPFTDDGLQAGCLFPRHFRAFGALAIKPRLV